VIVLDLGLPDMDGTEVITSIRSWSVTPVIVLSARTDADTKIRALDAGADDYVPKPFGMDEFMARLRAAIRRATVARPVDEPLVLLHIRDVTGKLPHVYFSWMESNPLKQLLTYVLTGSGDVPPLTREVIRENEHDPAARPMVHVG
jgi:DNA-binding response OmpR family regulator